MRAHGVREIARISCADWRSLVAEKGKPIRSHGATWTLKRRNCCARRSRNGHKELDGPPRPADSRRSCAVRANADERPSEPLDAKVFRVSECQKALDRACKEGRRGSHHASRFAAFVCNALHRKWRGYSDRFALAWTQRRRRVGNENLWASAARAQHCASSARELCAGRNGAGRRDCISCHG